MMQAHLFKRLQDLSSEMLSRHGSSAFSQSSIYPRFSREDENDQVSKRTALLAAIFFTQERGTPFDRRSFQRLGRAATRASTSISSDLDARTLARVVMTDMAIQRVAALRLDDIDMGLPGGLAIHRNDPDVAFLVMLGDFHSLAWESDLQTLRTIAYALSHDGDSPALQQVRNLIASAHNPLIYPLEANLQKWISLAEGIRNESADLITAYHIPASI